MCVGLKTKNPAQDEVLDDKNVEREGFEPSILLNTVYPLSRRAPSAARPPLQQISLLKLTLYPETTNDE